MSLKLIERIISGGKDILDEVITTKEEKIELENEIKKLYLRDKESARKMYEDDSSLQKIYAIIFLIGYLLLTIAMLYFIYTLVMGGDTIPPMDDWAIAFISTLFGSMSSKVNTICDFLFGGSKTQEIKNK